MESTVDADIDVDGDADVHAGADTDADDDSGADVDGHADADANATSLPPFPTIDTATSDLIGLVGWLAGLAAADLIGLVGWLAELAALGRERGGHVRGGVVQGFGGGGGGLAAPRQVLAEAVATVAIMRIEHRRRTQLSLG